MSRIQNALMILIGVGISASLKGFIVGFAPEGPAKKWTTRLYGLASVILGVTVQLKGRRKAVKSAGVGMVIFGVYDLIASNTPLGVYLPTIGSPTAFGPEKVKGYYGDYGQSTYSDMMGASLSPGPVEVVNGNISRGEMPEVIGEDFDLSDALEMSA